MNNQTAHFHRLIDSGERNDSNSLDRLKSNVVVMHEYSRLANRETGLGCRPPRKGGDAALESSRGRRSAAASMDEMKGPIYMCDQSKFKL